jgi:hypothetical protein
MVLSLCEPRIPVLGAARAGFSDDRALALLMTWKLAEVMTDYISANSRLSLRRHSARPILNGRLHVEPWPWKVRTSSGFVANYRENRPPWRVNGLVEVTGY